MRDTVKMPAEQRRTRRTRIAWPVTLSTALLSAVVLALILPTSSFASGDANESFCSSLTESSPGFRSYLPDCRAYELVTPSYKEGISSPLEDEGVAVVSRDGDHVIAGVGGAFAGAGNLWWNGNTNTGYTAYEFSRGEAGWTTVALTPPATEFPHSHLMAASGEEIGTTLWGAGTNALEHNENVYLRDSDGDFALIGPGTGPEVRDENIITYSNQLNFVGASQDLTHSLFSVKAYENQDLSADGNHSNLWPGDTSEKGAWSLYEYVYRGQPDAEPTLVGVRNEGPLSSNTEAQLISRCGVELGSGILSTGNEGSAYNAVSASGEYVFFTAMHKDSSLLTCGESGGKEPDGPPVNELYARVSGAHTVDISEPPLSTPGRSCTGVCETDEQTPADRSEGIFQGANEEGSKVFFLTKQPLVNGDEDTTQDLYMDELEGDTIKRVVQVSHDSNSGEAAEVQGVVRVSESGERVYFVAKGKLTGEDKVAGRSPEEAEPTAGADNLYVYDTVTDKTAFVATLLTQPEEETLEAEEAAEEIAVYEAVEDAELAAFYRALSEGYDAKEANEVAAKAAADKEAEVAGTLGPAGTLERDTSMWQLTDERPVQATPDGDFLVFLSSARLTTGDESTTPQLFEYDAGNDSLLRVSIGSDGTFDRDGNVNTYREAPVIPMLATAGASEPSGNFTGLALSEDGGRVFFTSAAALTPQAAPDVTNVYEYRGGNVYLISDGHDSTETSYAPTVHVFSADPSGLDVFFLSADALVAGAPEDETSLYDAREDGGLPAASLTAECLGESCRGAASAVPQLAVAGSAEQAGGGNLVPSTPKPTTKPKALTPAQKLARALKTCRKDRRRRERVKCESRVRKRYERSESAERGRGGRLKRKDKGHAAGHEPVDAGRRR